MIEGKNLAQHKIIKNDVGDEMIGYDDITIGADDDNNNNSNGHKGTKPLKRRKKMKGKGKLSHVLAVKQNRRMDEITQEIRKERSEGQKSSVQSVTVKK